MKKNQYKYYVCCVDFVVNDIELLLSKDLTYDDLMAFGVRFYEEMPFVNSLHTEDFKSKNILTYTKLSTLINDYLFDYNSELIKNSIYNDLDVLELTGNISDSTITEYRVSELINYCVVILRHNIKTGQFKLIEDYQILNCIDKILGNNTLNFIQNHSLLSTVEDETLNFSELDLFFENVESLIGKEVGVMTLYFSEDSFYVFTVFKNHSTLTPKVPESYKRPNGYFYECGFNNLIDFIIFNATFSRPAGVTLKVMRVNKDLQYSGIEELYGFSMGMVNHSLQLKQLTAEEVFSAFTTDAGTGNPIPPNSNHIYRGEDKNDVICGFDKV